MSYHLIRVIVILFCWAGAYAHMHTSDDAAFDMPARAQILVAPLFEDTPYMGTPDHMALIRLVVDGLANYDENRMQSTLALAQQYLSTAAHGPTDNGAQKLLKVMTTLHRPPGLLAAQIDRISALFFDGFHQETIDGAHHCGVLAALAGLMDLPTRDIDAIVGFIKREELTNPGAQDRLDSDEIADIFVGVRRALAQFDEETITAYLLAHIDLPTGTALHQMLDGHRLHDDSADQEEEDDDDDDADEGYRMHALTHDEAEAYAARHPDRSFDFYS